jgi:hypothetical protein
MILTRSRRRLLIVTLVVVGSIAGLWWMTRPKVDPRFVGRWRIECHGVDGLTFQFDSDGSIGGAKTLRWHVTGDYLVTEKLPDDPVKRLVAWLALKKAMVADKFDSLDHASVHKIISVSETKAELSWGGKVLTFVRDE